MSSNGALIILLSVALGCAVSAESPWYEAAEPCPDGATLKGTPWVQGGEEDALIACLTEEGVRHGPIIHWAPDGALLSQGRFEHDQPVEMVMWDAAGRERSTLIDGRWRHSWWHDNGQMAMQGTVTLDHKPIGTWTSWNDQGVQDGQVTWSADGTHGPLTGTHRLVLYADQAQMQLSGVADVPTATGGASLKAARVVTVTADTLLVDGMPVAPLKQGRLDPEDLRGQMITRAYDTLADGAFRDRDLGVFDGRIMVFAAPETPWPTLRAVLYTAGQAQYGNFEFVAIEAGLTWPTPQGPEPVLAQHSASLPRIGPPSDDPGPPYLSVMGTPQGARILAPGADPVDVSMAELPEALKQAATPKMHATAVVVVPANDATAQAVVDLLAATGDREAVLVGGAQ